MFFKEQIGVNAGLVWDSLSKNGASSIKDLRKATKLKEKDLYAALGWLAREGKIAFNELEADIEVALIL